MRRRSLWQEFLRLVPQKEIPMFVSSFFFIFMVLFIVWVLGWVVFHVTSGLIHILLIVAAISLIVHFARGRP